MSDQAAAPTKHCLCCGAVQSETAITCCACGEGSWPVTLSSVTPMHSVVDIVEAGTYHQQIPSGGEPQRVPTSTPEPRPFETPRSRKIRLAAEAEAKRQAAVIEAAASATTPEDHED